jgi:ABC-type transport system involved in multi-copper enzyme maturation permease subunit
MNPTLELYIQKFDDSLNAILVKELRQTVRGKFFWSIFLIYLVIICLILFFSLNEVSRYNLFNGDSVATFLLIALYFIAGLLVPIKIGKKTSSEIGDATNELLYTTTMSSKSIVTGKFLCGFVIILMLYSALVPFLSLTLFMGGVDLRILFFMLIFSFMLANLGVIWQIYLALWLGSSAGETSSTVNTVMGSVFHLGCWIASVTYANSLISDYSYRSGTTSLWVVLTVFVLGYIFTGGMLYGSTVSRLEPETSNKMYNIRFIASIVWMIGTVVATCIDFDALAGWTVCVFIVLMIISVNVYSEPDYYSQRIISEIPDSADNRLCKFPFFTGVANGLSWVALIVLLTTVVAFLSTIINFKHASDFMSFVTVLIVFILHINAHGLFANFLCNIFSKDGKKSGVGQIAFFSFVVVNIATAFLINMFFSYRHLSEGILMIVNPFFCLSYHRSVIVGIIGGLFWFGLGILCNIKTIINQFRVYFNKGYD